MTKKEFIERSSYHVYGRRNDSGVVALFYDWKVTDEGRGFKYCVYARALNSTKKDLTNTLYDFVSGKIEDTDWWIQLVVTQNDSQRFKVPIMGSGLNSLIKYS